MDRICIAGKNNIAVDVLLYLLEVKKLKPEQVTVVCNRGETGVDGWQKSLRAAARRHGVKEISLEEAYEEAGLPFLSLEFDRIVKPERFQSDRLYNIHFSLLPKYKGMYTAAMPILRGEKESGVTLHEIARGIDTGDIIGQRKFSIGAEDTARDVYLRCIAEGTALVQSWLERLMAEEKPQGFRQPAEGSTYTSRDAIDYAHLRIELNQTAQNIKNQLRAFHFREYQLPEVYGRKISHCEIGKTLSEQKPGTVLFESVDGFAMSTIDYDIMLYEDRFMEILECAREGNCERLKAIHGLSHYGREQDRAGMTPLMEAARYGQYEAARLLLAEGGDVRQKDYRGRSALCYAKGDSRMENLLKAEASQIGTTGEGAVKSARYFSSRRK